MEMSYFFSSTVYDFLFSGVNVVTTWGMVSLCMGLATLSLLAEGFKVARSLLLKVATSSHRSGCSRYTTQERSPLLPHNFRTVSEMQKLLYIRRVKFHILQTFLHIIHLTIGYVLMLAVMTYNAYFTIAVVGGAGLGYYCFSLFDLPSRVLGNLSPSSAKWPVYQSPQLQSAAEFIGKGGENSQQRSTASDTASQLATVLENGQKEKEGCRSCCEEEVACEDCGRAENSTLSLIQAPDSHNSVGMAHT